MAKAKKGKVGGASLNPTDVVFGEDIDEAILEAPDWVRLNLKEGIIARLAVKRLEDEAKALKRESNERLEAALAFLETTKIKTNLGMVLVQKGAPIFARNTAQEELIRLGVSADIVAKAWKKATRPGGDVIQFRAARIT